ncbi:hypothetical protein LT85_0992 [Collimonas arenae]|uniref:Uncharacterized protein n=1 Tax=Collimonas arenae TaxID=279058 RepID=A0A0A1F8Q6_9BURK|nr:hypothetical protein [Collimonas arenae]AIY40150.1 hypothetical protein LT85_0992 [Collimonas arenae]
MAIDIEAERKLFEVWAEANWWFVDVPANAFEIWKAARAAMVAPQQAGGQSIDIQPESHASAEYRVVAAPQQEPVAENKREEIARLLKLLKVNGEFSPATLTCIDDTVKYLRSAPPPPAAPALSDEMIQLLKDAKEYLGQVGCRAELCDLEEAREVIARIDAILPKE